MRIVCILLLSWGLFTACGKKKERPERGQAEPAGIESLSPFVPSSWDLKSDWQGSVLRWQELAN